MDKLDQFAAAALTGILGQGPIPDLTPKDIARDAYDMARAMMRERERRNEDGSKKDVAA